MTMVDNGYRSVEEEDGNWIVEEVNHGQSPCLIIGIITVVAIIKMIIILVVIMIIIMAMIIKMIIFRAWSGWKSGILIFLES